MAAMTPEDERGWTLDNMIMAETADRIAMAVYMLGHLSLAYAKKGSKNPIPEPVPIPRPGVAKPAKKPTGMKALLRALGAPV